jgi:hypothetical protein
MWVHQIDHRPAELHASQALTSNPCIHLAVLGNKAKGRKGPLRVALGMCMSNLQTHTQGSHLAPQQHQYVICPAWWWVSEQCSAVHAMGTVVPKEGTWIGSLRGRSVLLRTEVS